MNQDKVPAPGSAIATAGNLRAETLALEVSAQALAITLDIAEHLAGFAGHFPGLPILPGVIQLSWAVGYAREFLGQDAAVSQIDRLKFSCPIQPPRQVKLSIDLDRAKKHANFRFYCDRDNADQPLIFSQGRLVYE